MLEWIKTIDREAFLFLNSLHATWLDNIFFYGTMGVVWTPLYLLLLYFIIRKYRWNTLWVLVAVAVMVTLSDQLSNVVKLLTARPRPTHETGIGLVHTVNGYLGGAYGFYSAHASTNMALTVFMLILLQRPFRYFSVVMVSYVIFISYTRIYLGVHYPGDILAGWFAGGIIGWSVGMITKRIFQAATLKSISKR